MKKLSDTQRYPIFNDTYNAIAWMVSDLIRESAAEGFYIDPNNPVAIQIEIEDDGRIVASLYEGKIEDTS